MHHRLLHYDVVREIGRGAMGVVYEARDTRLDRPVALKILSPDRVSDPGRKQRFIHEARAASALNHPNIVTVHDINTDDGVDMIVMEYIRGKTLAELIPTKGLRASVAVKYAVQVADALAKAHGAGILHRDLKPANVMVTDEGRVKVLDFGLAKLLDRAESSPDDQTVSKYGLTDQGVVMGTTPYMSPEQAEGRTLDARSDIFSFGSVLHEMLTGERPFVGDSNLSTMAKIVSEKPKPVGELVPSVPPDLAKIVARCLRKDPARRYQFMADVKVALEDVEEESGSSPQVATASRGRRSLWVLVALAALLVAGGYLAWRTLRGLDEPAPRIVQLTTLPGSEKNPTIAPDGQQVAFTWSGPDQDNDDVYVQRIGSGEPLRLTRDPAVDFSPAWSPDGRWIAFLRGQVPGTSELRMIAPLGGPERRLGELHVRNSYVDPPFLAWMPDGRSLVVVDSPDAGDAEALFILSVETGEKHRLTSPQASSDGQTGPAVSSDGRSIVFFQSGEIYLLTLKEDLTPSANPRRLTESALAAQQPTWSHNGKEILFSASRRLWRLSVSAPEARAQIPFVGQDAFMPVLSHTQGDNSTRLIYVRSTIDPNIWRLNLPGPGVRASSSPALTVSSTLTDVNPQFSHDGTRIAFQSNRSGNMEIWIADADGTNAARLTSMGEFAGTARWAPGDQTIAFDSRRGGQYHVYVVSAFGGKPRQITSGPAADNVPSFSRDGKWLYFSSNRGGAFEIWKVATSGGEPAQVTHNRGFVAFESLDGSEIYYTQAATGPSSLWRCPTTGGEPVKVLDGVAERAFALVKSGIYYVEQQAGHENSPHVLGMSGRPLWQPTGRLRFYDFHSARTTTVSELGSGITLGLAASPDGRTVLFSRQDSPTSDLMLVENFR
jgi:serine/threonine protein kinase/Tol biopolymer transport system component